LDATRAKDLKKFPPSLSVGEWKQKSKSQPNKKSLYSKSSYSSFLFAVS
jgi:hypothetical protein